MRPRTMFCLLLPGALACSEREPTPTELRPEFAVSCNPRGTITASPTSVTKAPNTTGSATFFVTNNCTTTTIPGSTLASSRTGAVSSVGTPSPATVPPLAPGAGAKVLVSYTVGSSGSGTVVLTATSEADGTTSGFQAVTVTGTAAPTVTTTPATSIGTTTATLKGSANPNAASTTGWFRYWTANPGSCNDTTGTRSPSTGGTALGSGTAAVSYSRGITNLTVGTIYYFCAIASNSAGTSFGAIRYFVPVRFAVGMFMNKSDLDASPSTPDAKLGSTGGNIPQILKDAKATGSRIVMHVTRDNKNYWTSVANNDSTFSLTKWKADFDLVKHHGDSLRKYVKDGTLIGHYAIDEPFIDFHEFQAAELENMCQYQKQFWPFVPCIVRINPAILDSVKPGGYRYVDAGWATLTDFQYDKPPFNGNFKMWYDTNLAAARRSGLGMIYGFNLLNGGHEETPAPGGCAWTPPDQPVNCAMTAAEIGKIADAITLSTSTPSGLGHDQACAVIGWQLDNTAGSPERNYFFGTNQYLGNGMQAAMQNLWNKTAGAGLRPAPCNIRGDLPAP